MGFIFSLYNEGRQIRKNQCICGSSVKFFIDFPPSYYRQSADLVLIWVPFDSHSLFFIKRQPEEKIERRMGRGNCARETSRLHRRQKAERNWKEVCLKEVIAFCLSNSRLKLLTLFGQRLNLPLRSSIYPPPSFVSYQYWLLVFLYVHVEIRLLFIYLFCILHLSMIQ